MSGTVSFLAAGCPQCGVISGPHRTWLNFRPFSVVLGLASDAADPLGEFQHTERTNRHRHIEVLAPNQPDSFCPAWTTCYWCNLSFSRGLFSLLWQQKNRYTKICMGTISLRSRLGDVVFQSQGGGACLTQLRTICTHFCARVSRRRRVFAVMIKQQAIQHLRSPLASSAAGNPALGCRYPHLLFYEDGVEPHRSAAGNEEHRQQGRAGEDRQCVASTLGVQHAPSEQSVKPGACVRGVPNSGAGVWCKTDDQGANLGRGTLSLGERGETGARIHGGFRERRCSIMFLS